MLDLVLRNSENRKTFQRNIYAEQRYNLFRCISLTVDTQIPMYFLS